jgi:transposase
MPKPTPDVKRIKEVLKYKAMGLSNRKIAKMMDNHENQIRRWLSYPAHKIAKVIPN